MHPVAHVLRAVRAAALRALVLVMREYKIVATTVDVDGFAEQRGTHRRALDVPARTATPPGRVPAGLLVAGGFPEHEVGRVLLVGRHFDARAGHHLAAIALGELAVVLEAGDVEEYVPFGFVGVPLGDQTLDHRDDVGQVLGHARLDIRRRHAERFQVLVIGGREALRNDLDAHALLGGGLVDLVVDVRDVAHVLDTGKAPAQHARQHVEDHGGTRVADMCIGIHRRSTDIHCHPFGITGNEVFLAATEGVVQLHVSVTGCARARKSTLSLHSNHGRRRGDKLCMCIPFPSSAGYSARPSSRPQPQPAPVTA